MQDRPEGWILCNPPVNKIQEVCQIPVERPSIRFLLPLLRAFSSSSGFYKVIKSPYLPIIYLDNMVLMASSLENLLMARDTLIFILQHLRFLIIIKKSYLEPTLTSEFLEVIVDSGEITLSLPKEKLLKVQNHCQEILEKRKVTVRELSKLIGRLSSTAVAVYPVTLHYRHLQHQQICFICWGNYESILFIVSIFIFFVLCFLRFHGNAPLKYCFDFLYQKNTYFSLYYLFVKKKHF